MVYATSISEQTPWTLTGVFNMRSFIIAVVALCCSLAPVTSMALSTQETRATQEETTPEEISPDESTPQGQVIDVQHLFFKTVVLLIGICGLVIGGGYFLKRIAGGRLNSFSTDGAIVLLERKYLSPKTSLWIVEVNHQPLVVVDSQYGVAVHSLKETPESSDPIHPFSTKS